MPEATSSAGLALVCAIYDNSPLLAERLPTVQGACEAFHVLLPACCRPIACGRQSGNYLVCKESSRSQ